MAVRSNEDKPTDEVGEAHDDLVSCAMADLIISKYMYLDALLSERYVLHHRCICIFIIAQ
jgi:hypothetical protein